MIGRHGRPARGVAAGLAGVGLALAAAAAEPLVEYKVQAAYVAKFLLFVARGLCDKLIERAQLLKNLSNP